MGFLSMFKRKEREILEQKTDQKIFNILQEYLPKGWLEIVFFVGYYNEDSGYFKYWVKLQSGRYIDCFYLIPEPKSGEKDILQEQLMRIHKKFQIFRNKLNKKQKWVCMNMCISNNGSFKKSYDYADGISKENLAKFVEEYKNKLNKKYS